MLQVDIMRVDLGLSLVYFLIQRTSSNAADFELQIGANDVTRSPISPDKT
jgi:hypothetical protein